MALHFCQNPAEITVAQKFENKKTVPEFVATINRNASKFYKEWSVTYYSYFGYHR